MKKVLVAMSGGVDSSVTAYLLQQKGYECIGVTMKLYNNSTIGVPSGSGHTCCTLDDVEDAQSVAFRLGIPHYVFNFSDDFEQKVIQKFVSVYQRGFTPNPCIDCNRYLKFGHLYRRAKELDCDYIATGHYVQVAENSGKFLLKKAADKSKDQSYVLYSLTQDQLAHTLFPLGGLSKPEVREIAEKQGFLNAHKHDSQDICFIPDGDYLSFLEHYTGVKSLPGDFVDLQGKVLGKHRGAAGYTIGQRRGLGLAMPEPVYVCGKNMVNNTVTVGPETALYSCSLVAEDWNWIVPPPDGVFQAKAKIRYSQTEHNALVQVEDGKVYVTFDEPQRAISPGQAVVLYDGDIVLGGGTITEARET